MPMLNLNGCEQSCTRARSNLCATLPTRSPCTKNPTRTAFHCPFGSRGKDIDVRPSQKLALKEDALAKSMDKRADVVIAPTTQPYVLI